ncbi:MAG: FecR family protein [Tannerellaceae bacterium]|jgi:ferric-dicitrate binding protein FerR (iron transport regulator)|nr:FecR family protein [Tannerellaceae bacterium]
MTEQDYNSWLQEQWEDASEEMDPVLKKELLSRIKSRLDISQIASMAAILGKPKKSIKPVIRWIASIAAIFMLLLATGITIYFYNQGKSNLSDTIVAVERGQKASVALPDGTKVWINSDSEVTYGTHFNRKERVVRLRGEAFFEVTPDKERAFVVQTGGIAVKVLGTSFNIKSYDDEEHVSVALMTGKVDVESDYDKITMLPNHITVYNKRNHKMQNNQVSDAWEYAGWKDNTLSFKPETFENIAKILERYYNITILFESEALKKLRFRGTLKNTSLESILQILSLTSPLSYEIKDNLIILRENKKQKQDYERALK